MELKEIGELTQFRQEEYPEFADLFRRQVFDFSLVQVFYTKARVQLFGDGKQVGGLYNYVYEVPLCVAVINKNCEGEVSYWDIESILVWPPEYRTARMPLACSCSIDHTPIGREIRNRLYQQLSSISRH